MMARSQQTARMVGPWFWASTAVDSMAMMLHTGSNPRQEVKKVERKQEKRPRIAHKS
jgi:hypothetical protein